MKVLVFSGALIVSSFAMAKDSAATKAAPAAAATETAPATTEAAPAKTEVKAAKTEAKAVKAEAKAAKASKTVAAVPAAECVKLQDACKASGAKGAKLTDCVAKVAKGETVQGVTVTAEEAAACQAKLAPVK